MDDRLLTLARHAADERHGVVDLTSLQRAGASRQVIHAWTRQGVLQRLGPRSFTLPGTPISWHTRLAAAMADLGGVGVVAGRSGAALHGLDGFSPGPLDVLVPRSARNRSTPNATVRSTGRDLRPTDTVTVDGFRCLRPDRLILEAPLFGMGAGEIQRAIDSAVRLRLVDGEQLRERVTVESCNGVNGTRALREAIGDVGVESWLERRFVALLRQAGLPRPQLQRTYRDGTRIVARVDTFFPPDLVVELAGHEFHSSRAQQRRDEQRRTELTVRGLRVITFTTGDVVGRPAWVLDQLRLALSRDVA